MMINLGGRNHRVFLDENDYLRFRDGGLTIKWNGRVVKPYELVHRVMAEARFRRRILPNEDVHHKDGNKMNNNPENLVIIDHEKHFDLHERKYEIEDENDVAEYGECFDYEPFSSSTCGKTEEMFDCPFSGNWRKCKSKFRWLWE